jgi:hypothetical protein
MTSSKSASAVKPFKLGGKAMSEVERKVDLAAPPESGRAEDIAMAIRDLNKPEEFVTEINKLWQQATSRFLAIGRYLVQASDKLEKKGDFTEKVLAHLPFSRNTANQLRAIAYAVDRDRLLLPNELPRSWTNAYRLVRLPKDQLDLARREGLTSPNATRAQVNKFLASLKQEDSLSPEELRAKLQDKIRKRERELEELRARLADVETETIEVEFTSSDTDEDKEIRDQG